MQLSLERLQFSSILFGTVVSHAYYKREPVLHTLILMVTILSILNHSTHNSFINWIDMIMAHLLFAYATFGLYMLSSPFLINVFIILCLWIAEHYCSDLRTANNLHVLLHCFALLGLHGYLWSI